jgi:hypothetical protein
MNLLPRSRVRTGGDDRDVGGRAVALVVGAAILLGQDIVSGDQGQVMLLLNSKRIAWEGRSGWLSNSMLVLASGLFLVLFVNDTIDYFT